MIVIPVSFSYRHETSASGEKRISPLLSGSRMPDAGCLVPVYVAGYTMETTGFYQALFSFRLAWHGILC
jgi:hypothetical protein